MNAKRRVEYTRQLLESIGLEGQRLQMINLSSAMGGQFAFAAAEITAEIQRLGPNRLRHRIQQTGDAMEIGLAQSGELAQLDPGSGELPAGAAIGAAEGGSEQEQHEH